MSTWVPSSELVEWLTQIVEERISPADYAQFEEFLSGDEAARQYAVDYLSLHAQLTWNVEDILLPTSERLAVIPLEEDLPLDEDLEPVAAASDSSKRLLTTSYWRKHWLQFGGMALVLTVLFWAGFFVVVVSRKGESTKPNLFALPERVVAQVTQVRGAVWPEGATQYFASDMLMQDDTLELAGGFVEITFRDGAVVLLQGPALFTAKTRRAGKLEHGRLVARIEQSSREDEVIPFAISTPLAQIIDRGTEFGVEAEQDGSTQVKVFQGRVEATPQGEARTPHDQVIYLSQGDSAHIAPGDDQFNRQGSGEFLRELPEGEIITVQCNAKNWREVATGGIEDATELVRVYSLHHNRQNFTLLSFDVSAYYGATVVAGGQVTFTVESGIGIFDPGTFALELWQLTKHNAGVDLDSASPYYLDGARDSNGRPWLNHSGEPLEDLMPPRSVLEIVASRLSSRRGPFGGDTPTTDPAPGTQITFTIPRATLQSWLDQTAPPILVLVADSPGVVEERGYKRANPRVDFYQFGDGSSQPPPGLNFEIVQASTSVSAGPESPTAFREEERLASGIE